jgi:hypothetical protein
MDFTATYAWDNMGRIEPADRGGFHRRAVEGRKTGDINQLRSFRIRPDRQSRAPRKIFSLILMGLRRLGRALPQPAGLL